MSRFVDGDAPAIDALVEGALAEIGAEIEALRIPKLAGVVLGGGYARGEGGVIGDGLSNDLDFYVVTSPGASAEDIGRIEGALKPVSEKWSARLGIDVDFSPPKTPWRIKHDEKRLMVQELVHNYIDVALEKGSVLFAHVERLPPEMLPYSEALRLLANRGAGLLFARASHDPQFVARNINKAILGAGDARLIARNAYAWRAKDRAQALGDALYASAVEWKFRPSPEPPCSLERARVAWLEAADDLMQGASKNRSFVFLARWLLRRRTIGDFRTIGMDPTLRLLCSIRESLKKKDGAFTPSLLEDWKVFN